MPEFIVSWSAYGPSGRLNAEHQAAATYTVRQLLEATGVATFEESHSSFDGDFIVLQSPVKRYGDMASFGVCVYPVGGKSFYDHQREKLELEKLREANHATEQAL